MKSNELCAPRKVVGDEPARPNPSRLDVFAGSELNARLCDLQPAIMDLGLAAEAFLEANYEEQLQANLAAAGLEPLSYPEQVQLHMVRESLKAIAATMRLSYDILAAVARPDYDLAPESNEPAAVVAEELP